MSPTITSQVDILSEPSLWLSILIISLSGITLLLWRRYRSRRALMLRIRELEALSKAGRSIVAAELDVSALCELIAGEAGKVIDNSTFQIGLFERHYYNILFWTINNIRQETPRTFDLGESSGVVGWIRDSKQPLLVRDFLKEFESLPVRPRYISTTPPRSAIFIPLISGDRTIGIMASQSTEPNRFDEEDLRRLMILANQAAAAIANARLYETERTRAVQLELVLEIARQVNAIQDLEEIFELVVALIQETFGFHPVNIFGIDTESRNAVVQASSLTGLERGSFCLAVGEGLVGTAVATRQTTLATNTADDQRYVAQVGVDMVDSVSAETRSEIAIPLIVNGEIVGVLDVHSSDVGAFGEAERTVLEALAAAVAAAIHKAGQLAVQREQAWVTTAQLQFADAISQNSELDDLMSAITHLIVMLVGVPECGILLWDQELACYRPGSIYGVGGRVAQHFDETTLEIGDWGMLDAVHVGQEMRTSTQRLPWQPRRAPAVSVTLVPLIATGHMLGVLYVTHLGEMRLEYTLPILDSVPTRRKELLQEIANKTAQAVETVQLRTAQQEEAWVNTALLQVAEAVNNLINLDEILDTIIRFVPMLAGVQSCLILIWDESRQSYRAGPSYGLNEMGRGLAESLEIKSEEFSTLATFQPESLSPTTTYYKLQLPPWLRTVFDASTAHAFPLIARSSLVGALIVGPSANNRPLTGRRLHIITGIAHQAATAVVNNELYKESAERGRLEQELDVARRIQSSLIPPGSPDIPGFSVASYWHAARQVSGDFYDFFRFPNGKWGIVVADVADKGMPAALFMAVSRTILRTIAFSRHAPAETLSRVNNIINNDAQSDLFVTVFYAVWDPDRQTLTYANGGHNPPLLLRQNGDVQLLRTTGMALGVLDDIDVLERKITVQPGDTILVYTDGVTEAMNEDYDEFGLKRLQLVVSQAQDKDASQIMTTITEAIRDHAGDTPQFDDITLVVMKCHQQ